MCDTLVVVGADRVWFAKNSDRDPNEAQRLDWQPARDHDAGTEVRCTDRSVPQVRHTHAVLLSRPFWCWGAEMGTNEHGVVIGNEAVFTTAPIEPDGLSGMDLIRLALERSVDRHEAVAVITALTRQYGQGGRGGHENPAFRYHSSFLVADAGGAEVVETAGREVATEAVGSGVRSISNGITLPALRPVAKRLHERVGQCVDRRARTTELGGRATGPLSLFATLRDHGPTSPFPRYRWHNGNMAGPCMHAGGALAASQTTASWVSELRPGAASHWATATAAPCTALFKPIALDRLLDLGAPEDRADDSLWWRHERLHRWLIADPAARLPEYAAERDAIEARWVASPPEPQEAFAEGDALLARWTARIAPGPDQRPWFVRRYWGVRDARAGRST